MNRLTIYEPAATYVDLAVCAVNIRNFLPSISDARTAEGFLATALSLENVLVSSRPRSTLAWIPAVLHCTFDSARLFVVGVGKSSLVASFYV